MTAYHFNPNTGEAGRCDARDGACPFAEHGVQHYDSLEEARDGAEEYMAQEYGHDSGTLSKHSNDEFLRQNSRFHDKNYLANQVKTTEDPEVFNAAIQSTSKRAKRNAVQNPNVSTEDMRTLLHQDPHDLQEYVDKSSTAPIELMSDTQIQRMSTSNRRELERRASQHLTDEQADRLQGIAPRNQAIENAAKNPESGMSREYRIKTAAQAAGGSTLNNVVRNNPDISYGDVIEHGTSQSGLYDVARNATDPDTIGAAAFYGNSDVKAHALSNPQSNEDVVYKCHGEAESHDTQVLLGIAQHDSTPSMMRDDVRSRNKVVDSYCKIEDAEREEPGKVTSLTAGTFVPSGDFGSKKRTYQFDPQAVADSGFDATDVDTYMRYKKKDNLFGAQYDPDTGVYAGHID